VILNANAASKGEVPVSELYFAKTGDYSDVGGNRAVTAERLTPATPSSDYRMDKKIMNIDHKTAPDLEGDSNASFNGTADDKSFNFDPVQRYMLEIRKYKLLTRESEKELALRVREHGDPGAAYALVTANLRLVVKIASGFHRVWRQNLLDLIQEGNIGLIQAVQKYDPHKNVKFSYYASFWIKAYILRFIMDNWRLVKIGTTQGRRKLFFKLKKEKQKLINQGFDPHPGLLAERLGVAEKEVVEMDQRLGSWDVSLDAPLKDDSRAERIDFLCTPDASTEEQVAKKEMEALLHDKIDAFRKKMTPRELEIFDRRIFSETPVVLQVIADRYGISKERVRQVEKNIFKKLTAFIKHEIPDLESYKEIFSMN
jgi:RNA polymerase sigma-32 factor